jgi:hypothetical protein
LLSVDVFKGSLHRRCGQRPDAVADLHGPHRGQPRIMLPSFVADLAEFPYTLSSRGRIVDTFTRNYSIALVVIVIGLLAWWVSASWKPRVGELNEVLGADQDLASYVYRFRVVDFDNGVAVLSTPRDYRVPAMRFLEVVKPGLAGKAQDDPAMRAAQQELVEHQKRAQTLIMAQPGVDRVDWRLDVRWLADHGVQVPSG